MESMSTNRILHLAGKDIGTVLSKIALHCAVNSRDTNFSNELATILEEINVPNMAERRPEKHAWSILTMCSIGLKLSKSLQFEDLLESVDAKENEELLQFLESCNLRPQSVEDKHEKIDALLFMLTPLIESINVDPLHRVQELLNSHHAILLFSLLCRQLCAESSYIATWNTSILKRKNISDAALTSYELFLIGNREDEKVVKELLQRCVVFHCPILEVSRSTMYNLNKFYQVLKNNGETHKACLTLEMYCQLSWALLVWNGGNMLQTDFEEICMITGERSASLLEESTNRRIQLKFMNFCCSSFFSLKTSSSLKDRPIPIQTIHHVVRKWAEIHCRRSVTDNGFELEPLHSMIGTTGLLNYDIQSLMMAETDWLEYVMIIISKREQLAYLEFHPLYSNFCETMLNKINNYLQQHEFTIAIIKKISTDLN